MNAEENKEDWMKLFRQAAEEQDPEKLLALARETCRLLDERGKKLKNSASWQGRETLLDGRSWNIPERFMTSPELAVPRFSQALHKASVTELAITASRSRSQ